MLKKLLKAALFGLFFCGFNASAEGVRIEIETRDGEVQISVETTEGWGKKLKPSPRVIYPERDMSPQEMYPEFMDHPKAPGGFHSIDRRRDHDDHDDRLEEWPGPHCEDDSDCVEVCSEIFRSGFNRRRARDKCTDLSTVSVSKIKEVLDIVKEADTERLEDMNLEALKLLLSISLHPLEQVVDRMNRGKQKDFLAWLAVDAVAADIIGKVDDDGYEDDEDKKFTILKALFGSDKTTFISGINRNIDGGKSFVEKALDEWNEEALDWIHEFFLAQCTDDISYEVNYKCVFEYYCVLELNAEWEEEYMDYGFFEDTLDDILKYHRPENAPAWWEEEYMDSADLKDVWQSQPNNVCAALGMVEAEPQTGGTEPQAGQTEPQQAEETEQQQTDG